MLAIILALLGLGNPGAHPQSGDNGNPPVLPN